MNNAIFKYQINVGLQRLHLPVGAKVLSVGTQDQQIVMWAHVPVNEVNTFEVAINVVATGQFFDMEGYTFIGTVEIEMKPYSTTGSTYYSNLIYHIFGMLPDARLAN